MSETKMPAAEAAVATPSIEDESARYEFAFHVLPTVAEGEVETVYNDLRSIIEKTGGSIFDEEAPKRFDLAYEIIKHLEGKNRKFKSAYFGWIRFEALPSKIEEFSAEVDAHKSLLRTLVIRLTRVEDEHPFRFHEALESSKISTVDGEEKPVEDVSATADTKTEEDTSKKPEVNDSELDEALKKDEA